jgi:uncharacterized RDD family membrane protein YckC
MPLNGGGGSDKDYVIAEPAKRLIAYFIDCLFAFIFWLPFIIPIVFSYPYAVSIIVQALLFTTLLLFALFTSKDMPFKKIKKIALIIIIGLRLFTMIVSRILNINLILLAIIGTVIIISVWYLYIYTLIQYWKDGSSFGKCRMKITVVNKDTGEKISLGYMFLREIFGKAISGLILSLGWIWILIDKDKQGWHDKLVGSVVIKYKK